jgi:peroxiredoxin
MKRGATWAAVGAMLVTVSAARGEPLALGAAMPATDVKMNNVDGKTVALADVKGKAGTLVVFTCNHCPFVKAWQDRMVKIANDCVKRDIGVAFVNANDPVAVPEDALDNMKKLAEGKKYGFPYVVDDAAVVARAFGASRTPEAFLFDAAGKLVYHGTVDDSTYDPAKVTKQYLKDAVEALLAGKSVAEPETKSVGCTIKFPAQTKK